MEAEAPWRWSCQGCGTEHRERTDPTGKILVCPACTATTYFREA